MSDFYHILHSDLTHRTGWMLIHSLWQGLLIAFGLVVANLSLRKKSSQARYLAACLAMACQVSLMVCYVFPAAWIIRAHLRLKFGARPPSAD